MFWLHHSYVEKVFTDWQDKQGGIPSTLNDKKMAPFNDKDYNKFMQKTDLTFREAWDYKNRLCYTYKYKGSVVKATTPVLNSGNSQDNPKITIKIGFIIPKAVKGFSFTFSACTYDNNCEMSTAYRFGTSDEIDGNALDINSKYFRIELKNLSGLKMKLAEFQGNHYSTYIKLFIISYTR